jgi:AP-4 complex subunit epsilon-1
LYDALVLNPYKTLKLLNRIDSNIVASYYSQALQTIPSTLSVNGKSNHTVWMLELLETKSGEDGELYARELLTLLEQLENMPPTDAPVVEPAVERVLLCLRDGVFARRPLLSHY